MKEKLRRFIYKLIFPNRYSSEAFVDYLRAKGVKVGKGTYFYAPKTTTIDAGRPYLIEIGEYCKVTSGVTILCHDHSTSVLRMAYNEFATGIEKTTIGNNVFIGINSVILMGSKVGNNVIIGAGSVVSSNIPDNSVVAGNPARVIMSLEDYCIKCKNKDIARAQEYARIIYKETGKIPDIKSFEPFKYLFIKRDKEELVKYNFNIAAENVEDLAKCYLESKPTFDSFEDFLRSARINI